MTADALARSPAAAAERIAPRAGVLAERIERERELPQELLRALIDGGLFAMCLPRAVGGPETPALEFVGALETLARADGATACCAMIASTSSVLGAYLPEREAALIYDGGRRVSAGVFAPRGRAELGPEGWLISGRWSFASGVRHSDWVMGGCVAHRGEEPELLDGGSPDVRLMLMPVGNVEVIDTWAVSGLRGTGSHDFAVSGELVPAERAVSLLSDPPRLLGPLYSFPLFGLLALGIAAVALGIARGAIDDLIGLAAGKTPAGSHKPLALRATAQVELARSQAQLSAARALVSEAIAIAWERAEAGAPMSLEHRVGLRLAATHATETAAAVTGAMYHLGGGSSIYDSSPLQRRFRDAHVATQHMMVAPTSWELAGRLLLGVPTDTTQL